MRNRLALALMTAAGVAVVSAQSTTSGADPRRAVVDTSLAMMREGAWEPRARGFYHLFDAEHPSGLHGATSRIPEWLGALLRNLPERADSVKGALVDLLATENVYRRGVAAPLSEEYGSYFGDLLAAVASIDDTRAAPALLENIDRGALAMRGVARLGVDVSLDPLLALTRDRSELKRNAALRTLALMLDTSINRTPITPAAQQKIDGAFVRGVQDENGFVRVSAVEGLGRIDGPHSTELLRSVAQSDPFRQVSETGEVSYPVREAARKALAARRVPDVVQ